MSAKCRIRGRFISDPSPDTHENYSWNGNNWDIALIRLEDPISFNNSTQPVVLICDQQVELGVQDPGEMSWITGWGENGDIVTTIGQLNFFRWAIENRVLEYINDNLADIEKDMNTNIKKNLKK